MSDSLKKAFSTWTTTNLAIQTNFGKCNRIYLNKFFLAFKSQGSGFLAAVCLLINKFQRNLHSVLACVSNFCKYQVKITNIWYVINEWLGCALAKPKGVFLTELHWPGLSLLVFVFFLKIVNR